MIGPIRVGHTKFFQVDIKTHQSNLRVYGCVCEREIQWEWDTHTQRERYSESQTHTRARTHTVCVCARTVRARAHPRYRDHTTVSRAHTPCAPPARMWVGACTLCPKTLLPHTPAIFTKSTCSSARVPVLSMCEFPLLSGWRRLELRVCRELVFMVTEEIAYVGINRL
jgi:hypothetical protein